MEKLKNDEKAKHANHPDHYSQGCAFSVIMLMFLLLTIITSYETFKILPVPKFYFYGSLVIGMLLFAFLHTLGSAWDDIPVPLKWHYVIGVILLCASPLLCARVIDFGYLSLWVVGWCYIGAFYAIPPIIFPLMMIVTTCIAILCIRMSITIPRPVMKMATYYVVFFAMLFIWSHAAKFMDDAYDESIEIGGKTYHSIVYYGGIGDPGLVYLYECETGIFGCNRIYETDTFDNYRANETQLIYDETANVLRLEYHISERNAQYYDIPPILYEHPIR